MGEGGKRSVTFSDDIKGGEGTKVKRFVLPDDATDRDRSLHEKRLSIDVSPSQKYYQKHPLLKKSFESIETYKWFDVLEGMEDENAKLLCYQCIYHFTEPISGHYHSDFDTVGLLVLLIHTKLINYDELDFLLYTERIDKNGFPVINTTTLDEMGKSVKRYGILREVPSRLDPETWTFPFSDYKQTRSSLGKNSIYDMAQIFPAWVKQQCLAGYIFLKTCLLDADTDIDMYIKEMGTHNDAFATIFVTFGKKHEYTGDLQDLQEMIQKAGWDDQEKIADHLRENMSHDDNATILSIMINEVYRDMMSVHPIRTGDAASRRGRGEAVSPGGGAVDLSSIKVAIAKPSVVDRSRAFLQNIPVETACINNLIDRCNRNRKKCAGIGLGTVGLALLIGFLVSHYRNKSASDAPSKPAPPTDIRSTPIDDTSVQVSWTPSSSSDVTRYDVTSVTNSKTYPTTQNSITMSNLMPDTSYTFVVTTITKTGESIPSDRTSVKTKPSPPPSPPSPPRPSSPPPSILPPTDVVAVAVDDRSVQVSWTASPSSDIIRYVVTSDPEKKQCSSTIDSDVCVFKDMTPDTSYTFTIVALTTTDTQSIPSKPSNQIKTAPPSPYHHDWILDVFPFLREKNQIIRSWHFWVFVISIIIIITLLLIIFLCFW